MSQMSILILSNDGGANSENLVEDVVHRDSSKRNPGHLGDTVDLVSVRLGQFRRHVSEDVIAELEGIREPRGDKINQYSDQIFDLMFVSGSDLLPSLRWRQVKVHFEPANPIIRHYSVVLHSTITRFPLITDNSDCLSHSPRT